MATGGRVVFLGAKKKPSLIYEEVTLPELREHQILAKICLATICGSDLHTVSGKRLEETPSVLGHEAVAEVVESRRSDVTAGDRITFSILDSCSKCRQCMLNIPQKCQNLAKYGHLPLSHGSGFTGCYATHIILDPGTAVVKLPAVISDKMASSINCALATMVCATSSFKGDRTVQSALVQGAGMLGLLGCALLREMGVEQVYCSDIDANRLHIVPEFGGIPIRPWMTGIDLQLPIDTIDVVFEVCGQKSVLAQGMECIRPGGTYILVGLVHPDSELGITGEQLIRKCLTLKGVHNYAPEHLTGAVEFMASTVNKYPYEHLIGPEFPLKDIAKAVETATKQHYHRIAIKP